MVYQITQKEFEAVQDAFYTISKIDCRSGHLTGHQVRKFMDIGKTLEQITGVIEDRESSKRLKIIEYYQKIREEHGFKTIWSYWETDSYPRMDKKSIISPKTKIVYYKDLHHTRGWDFNAAYAEVEGDTWLDVWAACEKVILQSKETENTKIHGFSVLPETCNIDGYRLVGLCTLHKSSGVKSC
jgi:hypothetical protein